MLDDRPICSKLLQDYFAY